jgi:hypothetical protein
MDRKRFIQNTGRWTILTFIAVLVFFLARYRRISPGYSCAENEFCRNCSKFGACSLPQAIEQS